MEAIVNAELKIDKANWKLVKFSDVVAEPKETCNDVIAEGISHVVGLEHIDAGDVHLRKSASIEESTTFTKRFRKGDVLFGRRRAYLKKAAQAEFDGICSGDITVFRAKKDLSPDLLPFIVNNDKFFDYAVKHSAGGLSPRVKFKDLANYEFLLPPNAEQSRLAELLWAMDEVIEKEKEVLKRLEDLLSSYIRQVFTSHIIDAKKKIFISKSIFQTKWEERLLPSNWQSSKLTNVISNSQNGYAEGLRDENGIRQLRMNNVTRDSRIDLEKIVRIPVRKNQDHYKIKIGDVIFCNTNSEDLVGKSIIANEEIDGFTFSNHFTRLRADNSFLTQKFLYLWLKFHFDIGLFERLCTRWIGQAAVQTERLLKLQIILPPIAEQNYASQYCQTIENQIEIVKSKISASQALIKTLINQIF